MALSIQINYTRNGSMMTSTSDARSCLSDAAELNRQGCTVGSIAVYAYTRTRRTARTVAMWYGNDSKSYYGRPTTVRGGPLGSHRAV
jgi:hypothetical protein